MRLFLLCGSLVRVPSVERWMLRHDDELGGIARRWFDVLRDCGDDVRELIHDGQPTACVGDAAFAYVDAFKSHVNLGFFQGAALPDPQGLLLGSGKFMRHVKLGARHPVDEVALQALAAAAYADIRSRLDVAERTRA
jgi:hypothetical protein